MEGEVWECTGQEGDSEFDGRDECRFEATGKGRCPRVHADTGTDFRYNCSDSVLILLLISIPLRS